jgi:hypothetical protein
MPISTKKIGTKNAATGFKSCANGSDLPDSSASSYSLRGAPGTVLTHPYSRPCLKIALMNVERWGRCLRFTSSNS